MAACTCRWKCRDCPLIFASACRSLPFRKSRRKSAGCSSGAEIPPPVLKKIVTEAFNFPVPLVTLSERLHILELFHGPTLAFKDFGARFMARLMGYFVQESGKQLTVIVATSGDTGSAVAQAFLGLPGIRVVILYPAGRVSDAQEKQLTTLGQNITALEVSGSFDDCQRLAKQALVDPELAGKLTLTSANSINIGRLIPQIFYYFSAVSQLHSPEIPAVFSVPSGNFGNLTGGLLAKRIGLRIPQFIAATNANDVVPGIPAQRQHDSARLAPHPFQRDGCGKPEQFRAHRRSLRQRSASHAPGHLGLQLQRRRNASRHARRRAAPPLCPRSPHGRRRARLAIYAKQNPATMQGIVLATAHPAKFAETVARAIGVQPEMPERLAAFLDRPKKSIPFPNRFAELQEFLLSTNT